MSPCAYNSASSSWTPAQPSHISTSPYFSQSARLYVMYLGGRYTTCTHLRYVCTRVSVHLHVGRPQASRILRERLDRTCSPSPVRSLALSPSVFLSRGLSAGVGFVCAHDASEYIRRFAAARAPVPLYHKGTNHYSAISPPLGGGGSADPQDVDAMSLPPDSAPLLITRLTSSYVLRDSPGRPNDIRAT